MKRTYIAAGQMILRPCTFYRRCSDCAGWDGGDEQIGPCLIRDRATGRNVMACNDFVTDRRPEHMK
jgi:hypothetical protein